MSPTGITNIGRMEEDFNKENVFYCKKCLSLRIKTVPSMKGLDYCDDCGSTDIVETDIDNWRELLLMSR